MTSIHYESSTIEVKVWNLENHSRGKYLPEPTTEKVEIRTRITGFFMSRLIRFQERTIKLGNAAV